MFVNGLRKFLYAGALLALAPIMANAADEPPKKADPLPTTITPNPATTTASPAVVSTPTVGDACGAPAASCAPTTCKVRVCQWVDEPCEYTRTTYRPVTKQETYTAYRCETVTECKTKQVTVYNKVCETVMETRCITKRVPCWEERVEMVTKLKCVQVTEMCEKTRYNCHWVCCEVPTCCKTSCDPCNPCAQTCCTKTVRKLQVDKCTECVPVCRTKLVKECVPVCKKVCTYKCVTETCQVPVTKVTCVPECKTVSYNECRKVMVPYQATRCVTTCEACTEVVKGTKKVAVWVEKEVAVAQTCCNPCDTCAAACCGSSFFGGHGHKCRFGGHKSCSSGCGSTCGSACGVAATCCGGCN